MKTAYLQPKGTHTEKAAKIFAQKRGAELDEVLKPSPKAVARSVASGEAEFGVIAYYNSSGQVQSMSLQDMKDTFLHPAIDFLTGGIVSGADANVIAGLRGGTYFVNTSSGGTMGPIFLNTQADTSAYSSGGIPETLDQPTTMFSYYIATAGGVDNT